jgi:hypothetical protein
MSGLAIAVAAALGLIAWLGPEIEPDGTNQAEVQRPHTIRDSCACDCLPQAISHLPGSSTPRRDFGRLARDLAGVAV